MHQANRPRETTVSNYEWNLDQKGNLWYVVCEINLSGGKYPECKPNAKCQHGDGQHRRAERALHSTVCESVECQICSQKSCNRDSCWFLSKHQKHSSNKVPFLCRYNGGSRFYQLSHGGPRKWNGVSSPDIWFHVRGRGNPKYSGCL